MPRHILTLCLILSVSQFAQAAAPKLVVVVSVDQLCQSYLTRLDSRFADDGLVRRVAREGASYSDCHHRHAFTFTGPGHSVICSGAYPRTSGIIGNGWFNPELGRDFYCVECGDAKIVGLPGDEADAKSVKKISPKNLEAETIGDVLQTATNGKAKVIGLSLKDRAGVLMAGRNADAAYWFVNRRWVTSDHYRKSLPKYIHGVNESRLAERHAGRTWNLSRNSDQYTLFREDDFAAEDDGYGLGRAFPHQLAAADTPDFDRQLPVTPFGNEVTLEMARTVIEFEELGQDDIPDLLCVGLSSNDYVGHAYGPYSLEVEDITLQTDVMLGQFTKYLDAKVGKNKWTMVVTADHGVGPLPEFLSQVGFNRPRNPLGDTNLDELQRKLEGAIRESLGSPPQGANYVLEAEVSQVYLTRDRKILPAEKLPIAISAVKETLAENPAVFTAVSRDEATAAKDSPDPLMQQLYQTAHATRSGEVLFVLRPYFIQSRSAATHGSPWGYDTHVPMLWLGVGVQPGSHDDNVSPAQIAPTLARILNLDAPKDCVESPLERLLAKPPATAKR